MLNEVFFKLLIGSFYVWGLSPPPPASTTEHVFVTPHKAVSRLEQTNLIEWIYRTPSSFQDRIRTVV